MKTNGHFLFLGTGASMGIPVIGCHCAVCKSESPCNHRMRSSGLVTIGSKRFLIDCGPDFREQAIRYHIETLDGLLLTHTHHDHIAGIDELRAYHLKSNKIIPCLLSHDSAADLKIRYYYMFEDLHKNKLTSRMTLHILNETLDCIEFETVKIRYVFYEQAGMKVTGYRFGDFAYISDISNYNETIFAKLKGVKILVVSALRTTSSTMHFSIDQAIAFSQRVGASTTWLTHISHDLDHEATNALLPPNVRMAYDGLELNFIGE